TVRRRLSASGPIGLPHLLTFCWAIGIPIIQLRVFPLAAKRMCAMAVRVQDRFAILLAKESRFLPQVAYYVAHELGHIALGHLSSNPVMVDMEDPLKEQYRGDSEEA